MGMICGSSFSSGGNSLAGSGQPATAPQPSQPYSPSYGGMGGYGGMMGGYGGGGYGMPYGGYGSPYGGGFGGGYGTPYGGGYGMGYGNMGGYGGSVFGGPSNGYGGGYNSNMMYQSLMPLLSNLLNSRSFNFNNNSNYSNAGGTRSNFAPQPYNPIAQPQPIGPQFTEPMPVANNIVPPTGGIGQLNSWPNGSNFNTQMPSPDALLYAPPSQPTPQPQTYQNYMNNFNSNHNVERGNAPGNFVSPLNKPLTEDQWNALQQQQQQQQQKEAFSGIAGYHGPTYDDYLQLSGLSDSPQSFANWTAANPGFALQ